MNIEREIVCADKMTVHEVQDALRSGKAIYLTEHWSQLMDYLEAEDDGRLVPNED